MFAVKLYKFEVDDVYIYTHVAIWICVYIYIHYHYVLDVLTSPNSQISSTIFFFSPSELQEVYLCLFCVLSVKTKGQV